MSEDPTTEPLEGPEHDIGWWIDKVVEAMASSGSTPPTVRTVLGAYSTSSQPISVSCDDGRSYVIKAPHRDPRAHVRTRSMFTDQVVGRLGMRMGAPVARVSIVELPASIVRHDPKLSHVVPGPAHASLEISGVHDSRAIEHIDANRERFADLAVLYGWCCSFDEQFVYNNEPPHLVYSVDHGHFLPGGPEWSRITLRRERGLTMPNAVIIGGCRPLVDQLRASVEKLQRVSLDDIVSAVAAPPAGWGVSVADRVEVAMFLVRRRTDLIRMFVAEGT